VAKTATAPPDNPRYWRKVLRLAHPDSAGGDGDLFVWLQNVREHFTGGECLALNPSNGDSASTTQDRDEEAHGEPEQPARVDFDASFGDPDMHTSLTIRAVAAADEVAEPYAGLLSLLKDCPTEDHGRRRAAQGRVDSVQ